MNGRVFRMDIPAHQAVQELLPWYASSQLAPDEAQRVHAHLQTCMQCRRDLEWEHGMRAEAKAAGDELPPGVDMERALARLMPALGPQERVDTRGVLVDAAQSTPAAAVGGGDAVAAATPTAGGSGVQIIDAVTTASGSAAQSDATPTAAGGSGTQIIDAATTASGGGTQPIDAATAASGGNTQTVQAATTAAPRTQSWWRTPAANQSSWLRWAVAAQFVAIVGLGAMLLRPAAEEPAYHVLGSGTVATGNLVVMFQPNTSERELRRILQAQNARLVDGPTVTDAYLLSVPAANRDHALQALRAEAAVKLAEPMDGGETP